MNSQQANSFFETEQKQVGDITVSTQRLTTLGRDILRQIPTGILLEYASGYTEKPGSHSMIALTSDGFLVSDQNSTGSLTTLPRPTDGTRH